MIAMQYMESCPSPVYGIELEIRRRFAPSVGSNPTLSANEKDIHKKAKHSVRRV